MLRTEDERCFFETTFASFLLKAKPVVTGQIKETGSLTFNQEAQLDLKLLI